MLHPTDILCLLGTEILLDRLCSKMDRDITLTLNSIPCLRIDPALRRSLGEALTVLNPQVSVSGGWQWIRCDGW